MKMFGNTNHHPSAPPPSTNIFIPFGILEPGWSSNSDSKQAWGLASDLRVGNIQAMVTTNPENDHMDTTKMMV